MAGLGMRCVLVYCCGIVLDEHNQWKEFGVWLSLNLARENHLTGEHRWQAEPPPCQRTPQKRLLTADLGALVQAVLAVVLAVAQPLFGDALVLGASKLVPQARRVCSGLKGSRRGGVGVSEKSYAINQTK